MLVQKIYSEVEQGEEKIYSVLMTEDEINLFSEMSTKEFEEKEKEVKDHLKRTLGHGVGATVNGVVAGSLAKNAIKTKSKLAGAGALLAGGNTAYHSVKAVKEGKSWRKKGQEPRYQRKLIKELDKEWGIEDKK
jgi:uncharacterized membrane protein YebE (DUF533 family)